MSLSTSTPAEHPDTVAVRAGLEHFQRIVDRRRRLEDAQRETESHIAYHVGRAFAADLMDAAQAYDAYLTIRAGGLPGFATRWDESCSVKRSLFERGSVANGPNGTWQGIAPLSQREAAPRSGIPVVYVLFDHDGQAAYVGSTAHFRSRLRHHLSDGKPVARWVAYPAIDREAAYDLEVRLLQQHKPYLNRKVGR